jgi:hypothetical protein
MHRRITYTLDTYPLSQGKVVWRFWFTMGKIPRASDLCWDEVFPQPNYITRYFIVVFALEGIHNY